MCSLNVILTTFFACNVCPNAVCNIPPVFKMVKIVLVVQMMLNVFFVLRMRFEYAVDYLHVKLFIFSTLLVLLFLLFAVSAG